MNWLFFALLAPFFDTVILYLDRYVIEREVPDYRGLVMFGSIIGFVAGTIYWILTGFPVLHSWNAMIVLSTGIMSIWGLAVYYKALSLEETSTIIIFFKAIPIFVLLLSFLFLQEQITRNQFLGFIIIMIAVLGVSVKKDKDYFSHGIFQSGLGLILLVDILWAFSAILIKFAIDLNSFASILSYESWGVGIGGVILYFLFPSIKHSFFATVKKIRRTALIVLIVNECLYLFARTVTFYAYSLGPAALVSVIGGVQVFYGILLGFILTIFYPKTFHEDIRKPQLFHKSAFASLLLMGIYLMH